MVSKPVIAAAAIAALVAAAGQAHAQIQRAEPGRAERGQPEIGRPEFTPPDPNRDAGTAEADDETPRITVSRLRVRYEQDHPELPSIDDLMQAEVALGRVAEGYVAPSPGLEIEMFPLEDIGLRPKSKFTSRALEEIAKAVVRRMNELGVVGVRIVPLRTEFGEPGETDPAWGRDLRRGQTQLTLLVQVARIEAVRTLAFGERIPEDQRIDSPKHDRIAELSPVQAFEEDDPERTDVISKQLIDDYVFRLNRHPGRRVDTAISPGQGERGVTLDYLVSEIKPWYVYFQVSNTGTRQTEEWRERFGFVHNQLTSSDDILSLDYLTASFDKTHAFAGSYERPLWGDWLRGRIYGNWSEFRASDVGAQGQDFEGESYTAGGELTANIYQHRDWFVDAIGGVRFFGVETTNPTLTTQTAEADFLIPNVAVRLERRGETATTDARLGFEFNASDAVDTDVSNFSGRRNDDFTLFVWDLYQSFYLEPLIMGDRFGDPNAGGTLAHEIAVSTRGQYAFDSRLIPNLQQVAGGLYTVRGYPESAVAGDTVALGSIEYRLHLPQALGVDPTPGMLFGQPFRWQPSQAYGRADWDLVLKAFLDVGRAENSDRLAGEQNETLVGTGVGVDLVFKRNLTLRLDWGVALEEIRTPGLNVKDGSSRVHFVATILF